MSAYFSPSVLADVTETYGTPVALFTLAVIAVNTGVIPSSPLGPGVDSMLLKSMITFLPLTEIILELSFVIALISVITLGSALFHCVTLSEVIPSRTVLFA